MALSNANDPILGGIATALGYKTSSSGGGAAQVKTVMTNGTTAVNVFGTTNGFKGSVIGVFTIGRGAVASTITVKAGTPLGAADAGGFDSRTICAIAKGTTTGGVIGSAIGLYSTGKFVATGSLTVVGTSTVSGGQALVAVLYVPHT